MGKQHGGLSVLLCLVCAGALASLPSVAWKSDPDGIVDGTWTHHHALPPLSAPPPTAGADLPPSRAPGQPHFGFPVQPTFGFAASPSGGGGGEGYPFIGSNPTVPLPTGMTDILPMPDTGAGTATTKVVGCAASVRVQITMIALALLFSTLLLLSPIP